MFEVNVNKITLSAHNPQSTVTVVPPPHGPQMLYLHPNVRGVEKEEEEVDKEKEKISI